MSSLPKPDQRTELLRNIDTYAETTLRNFEQRTEDAQEVNRNALANILEANADTDFGRNHGFDDLIAEEFPESIYRKRVPLSNYGDYGSYIELIAQGKQNVLCAEPVERFAGTSGTTGPRKYIPRTASAQQSSAEYNGVLLRGMLNRKVPNIDPFAFGVNVMSLYSPPRQYGELAFGASTNDGGSRIAAYIPLFWTSPAEVFSLPSLDACLYLHALFGLAHRDAGFVNAVFSTHLSHWTDLILEQKDQLVSDISEGTISSDIEVDDSVREALNQAITPDPIRAQELEEALCGNETGLYTRIWPKLTHICTVATGTFAIARKRLENLVDSSIPIISTVYTASESMLGIQLDPFTDEYVLAMDAAYFEFIPERLVDEVEPPTITLDKLNPGERYEIVVSTRSGLYRYRMDDVIEVTGFHGEAPTFRYCYRRGLCVNLVGEKTHEQHVLAAVNQTFARPFGTECLIPRFSVSPQVLENSMFYQFQIELDPQLAGKMNIEALESEMDSALCDVNPAYRDLGRSTGRISDCRIKLFPNTGKANLQRSFSTSRKPKLISNRQSVTPNAHTSS